jgi:dihydrodipicolinate synthase/N-acetylneuraminate lyase
MLKSGFYPALGTPLNEQGEVIEKSLIKHIEQQLDANAAGFLLMGSMGIQVAIRQNEYPKIAKIGAKTVKGKVPLFVGAMDNSVWRVKDRIDSLKGINIDGIVVTTPFYTTCSDDKLKTFFTSIAEVSPYPVYLYDLAYVTKMKINFELVNQVAKHPNIVGIKTGDMILARELKLKMPKFEVLFSTVDIFDVANSFNITKVLDGMFSCTPTNTKLMQKYFDIGDFKTGGIYLDKILDLRNTMRTLTILPSFTTAMNLLGCEGYFNPDYYGELSPSEINIMKSKMLEIGEI